MVLLYERLTGLGISVHVSQNAEDDLHSASEMNTGYLLSFYLRLPVVVEAFRNVIVERAR